MNSSLSSFRRHLSPFCQQAGGVVQGKVFHDANRNGIYEPPEETAFEPKKQGQSVTVILEPCGDDDFYRCDSSPSLPGFDGFDRRFTVGVGVGAESDSDCPDPPGGCFRYECRRCYGEYKLVLAQPRQFDGFASMYDYNPPHDPDWRTSPRTFGDVRETDGIVRNNFYGDEFGYAETSCFFLSSDMITLEPRVQTIDWGMYFSDSTSPLRLTPTNSSGTGTSGGVNLLNETFVTTLNSTETATVTSSPSMTESDTPSVTPTTTNPTVVPSTQPTTASPTHVPSSAPTKKPIIPRNVRLPRRRRQPRHKSWKKKKKHSKKKKR